MAASDILTSAAIGIAIIFVVCSIIWRNFVIVVRESEAVVLERFQKFNRILRSGINFKWPFIDAGRQFSWTRTEYTADGRADVRMINDVVIDLRESVFNFQEQQVFTKDTVLVDVDAVMYYRIFNVKKAVYEIDDLQSALCNTAQTQLKEVFGNRTFTEALQSQTEINRHMQQEFSKIFARWGVECIRMQLRNLKPNDSQQIAQSMKKQMVAERHRRGDFIRAEGQKAAMKMEAEGTKVVRQNMGIAQQESTRKRSEGAKDAAIETAHAEGEALATLADQLAVDGVTQSAFMTSQRYLETFGDITQNATSKKVFVPFDLSLEHIGGALNGLPAAFGTAANKARAGMLGGGGGGGKGAFSVLD